MIYQRFSQIYFILCYLKKKYILNLQQTFFAYVVCLFVCYVVLFPTAIGFCRSMAVGTCF